VPGTQEASDAVLLAQVPTTAIVNRAQAEAQVKVAYAGEPQFIPIESTTLAARQRSTAPAKLRIKLPPSHRVHRAPWASSRTTRVPASAALSSNKTAMAAE
jgi:hypothetical protein